MDKKIDWIIHCCANGYCEECGEVESGFLPFLCNAHTHGMVRYGHMDFQLVLRLRRQVLRVIIPDKYNHFPEEPNCMPPYCLQLLETDDLYMGGQKL